MTRSSSSTNNLDVYEDYFRIILGSLMAIYYVKQVGPAWRDDYWTTDPIRKLRERRAPSNVQWTRLTMWMWYTLSTKAHRPDCSPLLSALCTLVAYCEPVPDKWNDSQWIPLNPDQYLTEQAYLGRRSPYRALQNYHEAVNCLNVNI